MSPRIFVEQHAEALKERAGEKYRPSNGTEGDFFFDAWCRNCQRDKAMREGIDVFDCDDDERCEIIALTFALDVDDKDYPHQWQYGKDGQPCCTAFVPAGEPLPLPRCTKTADIFGEPPAEQGDAP